MRRPMPMIVSVGRSGTTLLRLMLDAHPALAIPAETGFLIPLIERGEADLSAEEFWEIVTSHHTFRDSGLPAELFREELLALRPFSLSEGVRLFYRLYAHRHGKVRWGDKTLVYGRHLTEIEKILPEARFIHLIRDGRDVALSLREVWFAPSQDVSALARYWAERVIAARTGGGRCRRYLEVRYEDLVLDTRKTLQRVCRFLALPFAVEMEAYHRTARERLDEVQDLEWPDGRIIGREQRLRQHRWTSAPPDGGRVGRWRAEMSAEERRRFDLEAGDLLRDLGYDVQPAGSRGTRQSRPGSSL